MRQSFKEQLQQAKKELVKEDKQPIKKQGYFGRREIEDLMETR